MPNHYFSSLPAVRYEGPDSTNPLAFKFYNPDEEIGGQKFRDILRFAVSWWHTFCAEGADMFGEGTWMRPWRDADPLTAAKNRCDAAIEFMEKLSIDYYCFHDRDLCAETGGLDAWQKNLDETVAYLKDAAGGAGKKNLWGTANMFTNPRYMHGAATSPQPEVFAYAAAQVKKALDMTKELGGSCFVFWGGREGYDTLLNTDMGLEQDNLARLLKLAAEYAKSIGFGGQLLIEPKPMEPTKHQYDSNAATCLAFLLKYGLEKDFKLNLEANHASLAGNTFEHDMTVARINGILGSLDANQGDLFCGWDTDHFPTDIYRVVPAMYELILNGGIAPGGINFDAHVRRGSNQLDDLFIGYVAGMDAMALGYRIAKKLHDGGELETFRRQRYAGWKTGLGADIAAGKLSLAELAAKARELPEPVIPSGRQEMLEAVINRYIVKG